MKTKILPIVLMLVSIFNVSKANNIQTANISISGQNTAAHYSNIGYDISWDNSWRTSTNESNYDGCWLFIKFRKKNTSQWLHCSINYASPGTAAACGHTEAAGSTIKTSSDGKGIWQYRNADGIGNVSFTGNQLRWNYGADGVLDSDSVEVRVFAVEMVYIPSGAFYLGSGGTETYHFRDGAVDTYYPITSEGVINVGGSAGKLWAQSSAYIVAGTIPAAFPKGYNAIWMMKYEFSQQQYVDFLNNLNLNDANTLNYFATGTHPAMVAPVPERAAVIGSVGFLSFLDWAAMRPSTELEFEKACRGANIIPMSNEYAWGNVSITQVSSAASLGTSSETWAIGNVNAYLNGSAMRCGALATATSTRVSSGATYYGLMEMSGNVWEACVSAGNAGGLAFTGTHGDGKIAANGGLHNVPNWPIANTGDGLGYRGGGSGYTNGLYLDHCSVSSRAAAALTTVAASYNGRATRTAE